MKLYVLLTALLLPIICISQKLEGTVLNQNGQALEGAYIFNNNSGTHTHSGPNGAFVIEETNIGDFIHFSYLGYLSQTTEVTSNETLKVTMSTNVLSIEEVVISPDIDALNLFTDINININPVNSSQEILRKIPGLFIGQHAGGGKAEQIFLRGFDIDHGTDIGLTVDGLPINMVSHAHGQGYADLHFIIPETIENIDFGKGTYYADKGNFTTAGFVNFNTKNRLDESLLKIEVGQFNTNRLLGMFSILNQEKQQAYIATEYTLSDGPFESPQNFSRLNIMAKYNGALSQHDYLSITASHFVSDWDASGQIPERAVESGSISRFGAIDDTEGGQTSRSNIVVDYTKFYNNKSYLKNTVYYSQYDFELFSNFTFFLEDPINGDQIRQYENRDLFGLQSTYNSVTNISNKQLEWSLGLSLRNDQSNENQLSNTLNRRTLLSRIAYGNIDESNAGFFGDATMDINRFTFNIGLRADVFRFSYENKLSTLYDRQVIQSAILSPKINLIFNQTNKLQYYLKTGKGFHSNDSRVVIAQSGEEILPAAYSADLGIIWKPMKKMVVNAALWNLYLEQEFVYVGDAGIVEPSGQTNRQGIDVSMRYQPLNWLYWNLDANYTIAKSIDDEVGENYIPLAPDFTAQTGVNVIFENGIYGAIDVRHLDNRPANEDNSIVAEGYTIVDLNMGYKWKQLNFGFQIQNLLNSEWNETQFATESRLQNELNPVEEIHFTPGTPFFMKGIVSYSF